MIREKILAFCLIIGLSESAWAKWEPSSLDRGSKNTVQGCASKYTDESFLCVIVRCDAGNDVNLYVLAAGLGAIGSAKFVVEDSSFPISISTTSNSPIPDAHRAEKFPVGLREALKTGRTLRIVGASLTPGYDTVSLKGAGPAIARVEAGCGRANANAKGPRISSAADGRAQGLSNLLPRDECVPARIKGRVAKRHFGPPGSILTGVTVDGPRRSSEFLNVEIDETVQDKERLQVIRGALDALLVVGQTVDAGFYRCGAAGRVQMLHSVSIAR